MQSVRADRPARGSEARGPTGTAGEGKEDNRAGEEAGPQDAGGTETRTAEKSK